MKKNSVVLLMIFPLTTGLFSQTSNDAGLWCTLNVTKKINKKIGAFITEDYRLKENFTRQNLFYTDLGLYVKPYSFLKISVSYRTIEKFLENNLISFRHRGTVDITLKHNVGWFGLSYRQRVQSEFRNINSSPLGRIPEWFARSKFGIKYDLNKPITPYIAAEFRYQLVNPRSSEVNGLWHRNRYIAGLDYKRNDRYSFGLFYMIQKEFNISAPQNLYILGLEFNISL